MVAAIEPGGRGPSTGTAAHPGADPLRAEQVRMLYGAVSASIPAALGVAGAMAYMGWGLVDRGLILAWLGVIATVNLGRAALALAYFRRDPPASAARGWLHAFTAGALAAGAAWGAGLWLLYPPHDVAHQAALAVLAAGVTAGAVASLAPSRLAVNGFVALTLLPLSARFLGGEGDILPTLGVLVLLYLGVAAAIARQIHASVHQNVRLRLEINARLDALRASEEQTRKLSLVAARTDSAVIIADAEGRVEWVNDGFTRMSGYPLEEMRGRRPGDLLQGPMTDPAVAQDMQARIEAGVPFSGEILNYGRDGRPYVAAVEIQPLRDPDGRITHFMALGRDVTGERARAQELEEARARAEAASRAKSNFLAMMSHEVRTPLYGVLGALGLLLDTRLDGDQEKLVQTARRSGEWLLSIINDILDFSKMESGRLELEPSVFSPRTLVERVVEMLGPRTSEKAIGLAADIAADVPEALVGDASKVRQVLLNLAGNAVKFTDRGRVQILVSCLPGEEEGCVRLRLLVDDTGVGIPREEQRNLFQEFWTRSLDRSPTGTGTGLGLAISRRLVETMGGSIEFSSEPGRGSRFWFDVPLGVPTGEALATARDRWARDRHQAEAALGWRFRGRVLLAEDNAVNQMIGRALLEGLGLKVDVAANGLEALEAVRRRPYDLVLMDIGMPEMNGIEATRAIRALGGRAATLPVVALTAHVMRGERESVLAEGLDDHVGKPVDRGDLVRCLARWLPPEQIWAPGLDGTADAPEHAPVEEPQAPGDTAGAGGGMGKQAAKEALMTTDFEHRRTPDTVDPTPCPQVIDRTVLEQLIDDVGDEAAPEVMQAFQQALALQMDGIQAAYAAGDLTQLARLAHRMKSGAASVGAAPLSRLAAVLEQAGRTGDASALERGMAGFPALAEASGKGLAEAWAELGGG